ncbi:HSP20 family protein [Thermoactinomyces sp. DSM 45891]|uniref:Hsp20/alpha crystallin family protein n=1 Tax=Thermoactinomyces sp. DSM 45891 TaxID=1761907 RepID=UPI000911DDC0|nr:Hsp20/alpha crystallin family protein [Thermoactinomyces sp. DSM 45891]SFX68352.1 HSP20 family protein [Thermoactinomyces sp. DSM 45891]
MKTEDFSRWQQLAKQFLGDEFFQDIVGSQGSKASSSYPAVDVYQGKNEVIVLVNLPGVEEFRAVDIKVEGDQLTISGNVAESYGDHEVIISERKQGPFSKTVSLGAPVARKYKHARYRRGVLELRYPKL